MSSTHNIEFKNFVKHQHSGIFRKGITMKKLSLLLLSLSALFLFAGCGSSSSAPRDVAVKWYAALIEGDLKTANELSTEQSRAINGLAASSMSSFEKGSEDEKNAQENLKQLKNAKVEIDGDTARLIVEGKSDITLKKVDGEWKVDFHK